METSLLQVSVFDASSPPTTQWLKYCYKNLNESQVGFMTDYPFMYAWIQYGAYISYTFYYVSPVHNSGTRIFLWDQWSSILSCPSGCMLNYPSYNTLRGIRRQCCVVIASHKYVNHWKGTLLFPLLQKGDLKSNCTYCTRRTSCQSWWSTWKTLWVMFCWCGHAVVMRLSCGCHNCIY